MKPTRHIRRLTREEDGTILVLFAMALVVFLGLVALSFDFGRAASTQTDLQNYADQVALAAAGELDGKTDSITRATAAAANLISDSQTFASGSRALGGGSDYTLTFYSTLPSSDSSAMTASTTNPAKAAYVRVSVSTRTVITGFLNAFNALRGSADRDITVNASAVAGFTQYACDITPMMMCIPSGFNLGDHEGEMIVLRAGGQGAAWGPGDFGFLDPSTGALADPAGPCGGINSGPQVLQCVLAAAGPVTQCFRQRGVDTEPGQKVGLTNTGLNTRFDIYTGSMKSNKNDADFAPAPNVIKGIVPQGGGSCIGNNSDPSPDTASLPRDTCIDAGTCGGGRFGDGVWDRTNYVSTNYGGADPHPTAVTRYQYYKDEVAAAGGAGSSTAILTGKAETGRPMCSNNQYADPDRRTIIVAAIDCTANPISGSATGVPVEAFYKIFLTEPVGADTSVSPAKFTIYGEVVGRVDVAGSGSATGIIHDVVQLYR